MNVEISDLSILFLGAPIFGIHRLRFFFCICSQNIWADVQSSCADTSCQTGSVSAKLPPGICVMFIFREIWRTSQWTTFGASRCCRDHCRFAGTPKYAQQLAKSGERCVVLHRTHSAEGFMYRRKASAPAEIRIEPLLPGSRSAMAHRHPSNREFRKWRCSTAQEDVPNPAAVWNE